MGREREGERERETVFLYVYVLSIYRTEQVSLFRPDAADGTRELTSWEKEQQQQQQQLQLQQPPPPPSLAYNRPDAALQPAAGQAKTKAKGNSKQTGHRTGQGKPTQQGRHEGAARTTASQSMRRQLQPTVRTDTVKADQSTGRGEEQLADLYRGTGLLSPGSMGPSSPAERSSLEDSLHQDGADVSPASSPVRVRLTMDDLSSPVSPPPSQPHQFQHRRNQQAQMQQEQRDAVGRPESTAVLGDHRDIVIVSCCQEAHTQAEQMESFNIRLLRSGGAVAQAAATENDRFRQQLEQYVQHEVCGQFVRDLADSDGGGAVDGPDISHLYRQTATENAERVPSSLQRQPLSWPQYRRRDGEAMLRFVLAPVVEGQQPSNLLGWWCLAANRAEATAADCLAKFPVTLDSERGRVPTDPSALSRWEVNGVSTARSRGHNNSDLRLVISENRRRKAEADGAVAKLVAKYKLSEATAGSAGLQLKSGARAVEQRPVRPEPTEGRQTRRGQRAGSVGSVSSGGSRRSRSTRAEAGRREMARVRAARAAAGSPGAVRYRSRSGAHSPVRSDAAGHGARDSMFALQQDVTASLGSAGRARSQSHSPPARSRPRSPSPPAPSAARRGRTPAAEIRWSSRHSAVEQSEPVQDSYARFPADVGVVTGSGREGWVYREQRAESPQRVTLRLKPSGSRQRARARGMGR